MGWPRTASIPSCICTVLRRLWARPARWHNRSPSTEDDSGGRRCLAPAPSPVSGKTTILPCRRRLGIAILSGLIQRAGVVSVLTVWDLFPASLLRVDGQPDEAGTDPDQSDAEQRQR